MAIKEIRKPISFEKGIDQSIDDTLIPEGTAYISHNIDLHDGILKGVAMPNVSGTIIGYNLDRIFNYFVGTQEYMFGSLYDNVNKKWVVGEIKGNSVKVIDDIPNGNIDFINYKLGQDDVLIYCCHNYPVKVYDYKTDTVRELKRLGAASEAGSTNRAPYGTKIELHKERLFISGNTSAPNRVYFSKDFDADDFTTPSDEINANNHGGFIDLLTFDNSSISGIKSMFDRLIIFKKNTVFAIYGDSPANYGVQQLFVNTAGDIIDSTIKTIGNYAFFVSTDGIYRLEGYGYSVKNLTPRIKKLFTEFTLDQIQKANATIYKNKYIVKINTKLLVYDIDRDTFSTQNATLDNAYIHTIGTFRDGLYATKTDNILKYPSTFNIVENIGTSALIETGYENYGYTGITKKAKQLDFIASGTAQLKLTIFSDKGTKEKIVKLVGNEKRYRIKIKRKGFVLGVRIESINSNDFEIRDIQLLLEINN